VATPACWLLRGGWATTGRTSGPRMPASWPAGSSTPSTWAPRTGAPTSPCAASTPSWMTNLSAARPFLLASHSHTSFRSQSPWVGAGLPPPGSFFPVLCSSAATKERAAKLADQIGATHHSVVIDTVVSALIALFQLMTGKRPRYKVPAPPRPPTLPACRCCKQQPRLRMAASRLTW
jgi:hypothetical protein